MCALFLGSAVLHRPVLNTIGVGMGFLAAALVFVSLIYQSMYRKEVSEYLGIDKRLARILPLKSPGFERFCDRHGIPSRGSAGT